MCDIITIVSRSIDLGPRVRVYIFWRGVEKGACYVAAAELLCLVWGPCSCLLCTGITGVCHHAWLESCCKMLSHHQGLTVKVYTCDPLMTVHLVSGLSHSTLLC